MKDPLTDCQKLFAFCMDFLEGELPHAEQTSFQMHLARCSDCVSFFETYRRTPEVSREALATAMPVTVKESVRAFLRSHRDT